MRINAGDYDVLPLGIQTDGNVTEVAFDLTPLIEQAGDGFATVFNKRPTETDGYPCSATRDGNTLIWLVGTADTEIEGNGEVKVVLVNGDKIINSLSKKTTVIKTFNNEGEVPEPYEAWVNEVLEAAEEAVTAKDKIANLTATANVSVTTGEPSVTVTKTEDETTLNLDFLFNGLFPNISYDAATGQITIGYGG